MTSLRDYLEKAGIATHNVRDENDVISDLLLKASEALKEEGKYEDAKIAARFSIEWAKMGLEALTEGFKVKKEGNFSLEDISQKIDEFYRNEGYALYDTHTAVHGKIKDQIEVYGLDDKIDIVQVSDYPKTIKITIDSL